jgi:hypothetical protein
MEPNAFISRSPIHLMHAAVVHSIIAAGTLFVRVDKIYWISATKVGISIFIACAPARTHSKKSILPRRILSAHMQIGRDFFLHIISLEIIFGKCSPQASTALTANFLCGFVCILLVLQEMSIQHQTINIITVFVPGK